MTVIAARNPIRQIKGEANDPVSFEQYVPPTHHVRLRRTMGSHARSIATANPEDRQQRPKRRLEQHEHWLGLFVDENGQIQVRSSQSLNEVRHEFLRDAYLNLSEWLQQHRRSQQGKSVGTGQEKRLT